jgi:Tol biopolymer transport system component
MGREYEIKTNSKFWGIIICLALRAMIFSSQSCRRERSTADLPGSQGISAEDYYPVWSPDGKYLTFSCAPSEGSNFVGNPEPGSDICVCDLSAGK